MVDYLSEVDVRLMLCSFGTVFRVIIAKHLRRELQLDTRPRLLFYVRRGDVRFSIAVAVDHDTCSDVEVVCGESRRVATARYDIRAIISRICAPAIRFYI